MSTLALPVSSALLGLLAVGFLAHEMWRWMGVGLSRGLSVDSPVIGWVRAVSTALVAALVMRLIVFPLGALTEVGLIPRGAAFLVGLGVLYASKGNLIVTMATALGAFLAFNSL